MKKVTSSKPYTPSLLAGVTLGNWVVQEPLGHGGYGELYTAHSQHSSDEIVALKVEPISKRAVGLHKEIRSVKLLQQCPRVARYYGSGVSGQYRYMAMQLLGLDLHKARHAQPTKAFGVRKTAMLGIQMLDAIQDIHEMGYLHCDIKPSNFVLHDSADSDLYVYVIDFGHAVQHLDDTGKPRPKRDSVPFRGTVRYSSPHVLLRKDPGRRDDLWSLLFALIEMAKGSLSWPKNKDKEKTRQLILSFMRKDPLHVVRDLPIQFENFLRHLINLKYEDVPNYDLLRGYLHQLDAPSA